MQVWTFRAAAAVALLISIAAAVQIIDCSSRGGPTTSMEVTNPYNETVSIRTCNNNEGCIGAGNSTTRYGDCLYQEILPVSTVKLVFDSSDPHAAPHYPMLDAVQYLVFDNDNEYSTMCTQNNQTAQQALSRDEFWGKGTWGVDNVTWPARHTIEFPQRTCHFCAPTAPPKEFTMEVINSYAEQTWVKVRTCRHAKCSGDNWEPAHYDDCWDKITSNSSAKVRLDKAVQYVVFSCTGILNEGTEVLYKPETGWPQSVSVDCAQPPKTQHPQRV